jgi:hypothetical protein
MFVGACSMTGQRQVRLDRGSEAFETVLRRESTRMMKLITPTRLSGGAVPCKPLLRSQKQA